MMLSTSIVWDRRGMIQQSQPYWVLNLVAEGWNPNSKSGT